MSWLDHCRALGIAAAAALGLSLAVGVPVANAAVAAGPQWTVTAVSLPTNFAPGSTDLYTIKVVNTGGAPSDGTTVTITDTLPSGLTLKGSPEGQDFIKGEGINCAGTVCSFAGVVRAGDWLTLTIPVEVTGAAGTTLTNQVTVSGGGAPEASRSIPTLISSEPAKAGIAASSTATALSNPQAGAHSDLTTAIAFNTVNSNALLAGSPRETVADLPPGFAGDVADSPACPVPTFSELGGLFSPQHCPLSTQVGVADVEANAGYHTFDLVVPVYNLAPNPGEVAKLGFFPILFGVEGTISLRPGDYGVRTAFHNIDEAGGQLDGVMLEIWGVPAAHSHDTMRGLICNGPGNCSFVNATEAFLPISSQPSTSPELPYLTNPTQCTSAPLQATLSATFWEDPGLRSSVQSSVGPLTGCQLMEFAPSFSAAPDTTDADTPAGLSVDVHVRQEGLTGAEGTSSADIRNTTVTLPQGVVINPGQAAGLQACQASEENLDVEAPPACPGGSRVGQDEIRTPLLKEKLEGSVYLLQSNPPDIKLLVEASQPLYGIYVKLIGNVHLNESTGQLTTTFKETPELPFSDFKLSFSGGAQAALATPTGCGIYTTSGEFEAWSAPVSPDVFPVSEFAIEHGSGGSACAAPLPFAPSMIAGSTTDQAGGFTDFSMLLSRPDDQQRISALQFKTPEGLLGEIAKVALCQEPQASQGNCPAASQIGHTVVEAGPGPYPLVVPQPGRPPAPIYLTGPYEGAPFGLSIVVPLEVGPFVLQTQVVRAKIEVDPLTAELTVITGALPSIIDGIPSDLRTINAMIDRPEFMFNPTGCQPMSFSGTATSAEGATASLSSHLQMGSCRALLFKPDFRVSTSAHTSRAEGASLDARILYPSGPLGANQASSQSNVREVKVELPKQLPSRLTTLQKACPDTVFNANPASCPAASRVGEASAITPVLPVPLTGPAYFVSHGGAKFPELIMVISGEGVTVQLHGETFISKAGITSSTFKNVPDVPISSFELKLPEGPDSALAANGDLCASKLIMPTVFTGQNGAVRTENTKISVEGCTPEIRVLRHRVSGKRATVVVSVPSAGTLVAGGHGVSRVERNVRGGGTVTITLRLSRADQRFVAHHHDRRLMAPIRLSFAPSHGRRLEASVAVLMR